MKYVILIFASLLAAVSVYSQAPDTWTQKANFGGTIRDGAIGFSIGSNGYIGTGFKNGNYYKDFWEYDPALNTWTQKADFGGGVRYNAVGFSIGSKGYVGTGSSNIYPNNFKDFWEYDPALNTWTQKADFGGTARYSAVGFSIVGKGYLGTGYSTYSNGSTKDFWEYDPALNTWTQKQDFAGIARYGSVGFSMGSKGYLGTGTYFDGTSHYIKDFWEYDASLNTWFKKADFGGTSRSGAVGFSIWSKGYLGTGYDGVGTNTTYYKDFWEYDPTLNTWTQKTDFGGGERSFSVGFSMGSKGYLGTGYFYDGTGHKYKNFWEYTPECTGLTVYADADSDGYGDAVNSFVAADCIVPEGYITTNSSDCDDANAAVNPTISEVCGNAIDDDCNGQVDCCLIPAISSITNITSSSFQLNWQPVPDALNYKIRYKVKNTDTWLIIKSPTNAASIVGLTASTVYALQVKSVCNRQPSIVSDWSFKAFPTTAPLKMADALSLQTSLELYPNPSSGDAVVHLILSQSSPVSVKIFDVNGKEIKIVVNQALDAGDHFFSINTALYSKGLYFVQLISERGIQHEKLIVQ